MLPPALLIARFTLFLLLRSLVRLSRGVGIWALVGGYLLLTLPLKALSVIPPTFAELVSQADNVVRIKVTKVSSRWDSSPQGPVIRTYVECEALRTLKGPDKPALTLRFLGGKVGDEAMIVAEMPTLEEGQTYVVFLAENGAALCPLVAGGHGSYPLVRDATSQVEYVSRSNRQPLRAVDDVETPLITRADHPALRLASGPGLTREAFEAAIVQELARAGR